MSKAILILFGAGAAITLFHTIPFIAQAMALLPR